MKTFAAALTLIACAGAAFACPDGAKDAQAGTGLVSAKLAAAQPQMSQAPAVAPPKATVATPKLPKAATPTTAATDTTKKAAPGG